MDFVLTIYQQIGQILRCLILKLLKEKFILCTLPIVVCSALITYNQFKGPISCNVTDDLKGQESVINSKCRHQYSNIENPNLTVNENNRMERLLNNYDKTNNILGLQILFFFMSIKLWSIFKSLDMEKFVNAVNLFKLITDQFGYDEDLIKNLIGIFESLIRSRKPLPFWKSHRSEYALMLFSCSKISFTIGSFVQLYFLDGFIGNGSQLFGVEVLSKMWHGESLSQLTIFPRDTICYYKYPDDENDHQYSRLFKIKDVGINSSDSFQEIKINKINCHLTINQLNDKIFTFLWFWLFVVSIISLIDLISWIKTLLIIDKQDTYTFMRNRLSIDFTQPKNETLLRDFVEDYLKEDLVLIFRLLSLRESKDLTVSQILNKLFDLFVKKQKQL